MDTNTFRYCKIVHDYMWASYVVRPGGGVGVGDGGAIRQTIPSPEEQRIIYMKSDRQWVPGEGN